MNIRAVVTPHRLSAEAGRRLLLDGGNAIDAAIAAVAAQGVVAPETCGVGGDLFALVHRPGWDRPRVLNASGRSGSNVDAESLRAAGHSIIPADHPAVVTVPGCVDGLLTLSNQLGTRPLEVVLGPAIELAEEGFEASHEQSSAFSAQTDRYRDNLAVASFYPGGAAVTPGTKVTRPQLAATLRLIAETGERDRFYLGAPGEDIIEALGDLVTRDDLARNQAEWVDPIGVDVFGMTAWTTPPNSQGYLGPAALAVFEMLGPPTDTDDPEWWHLLIEAYRCIAWERDDLVADPGATPLSPAMMVDRDRLERLAESITPRAGRWPHSMGETADTAYMCVADGEGMAVSIIQSNFHGTGSPYGAARSGFLLHDRGRGFNLMSGHPNELEPGKRPLHTLSPTLWTKGTDPAWVIGTRGGAIQPQLVAQMAARVVGLETSPGEAQSQPRWSIADFGPGSGSRLAVEPGLPPQVLDELMARGHQIEVLAARQPGWGPVSVIGLDGPDRVAAADPRVDTTAALIF